jgi:hypothetical protein
VDCTSQVIVAHDLTNEADDRRHLSLMLQRCEELAGEQPKLCLADAGYWSEANAKLGDGQTDLLISVDCESTTLSGSRGSVKKKSPQLPEAVKMRGRLTTEEGREQYSRRASSVEPVFGQMCMRGLNGFLLRSMPKAAAEWSVFCSTHNLL